MRHDVRRERGHMMTWWMSIWIENGKCSVKQSLTSRHGMNAWKMVKELTWGISGNGQDRCTLRASKNFWCFLNHLSVEYYVDWFILSEIGDYLALGFHDQNLQLPKYVTLGPGSKIMAMTTKQGKMGIDLWSHLWINEKIKIVKPNGGNSCISSVLGRAFQIRRKNRNWC